MGTNFFYNDEQDNIEPQQSVQQDDPWISDNGYESNDVNPYQKQDDSLLEEQAKVAQLQEKLGVQNEETNPVPFNEEVQDSPQVSQAEVNQVPDNFAERFNTEAGKKLVNDFKQVAGIDLQEAFQVVQDAAKLTKELDTWRRDQIMRQQHDILRQELGSDYDTIMPLVLDRFKALPDHMKGSLDSIDGARLLAAQIKVEAMQNQGSSNRQRPSMKSHVRPINSRSDNSAKPIRMSEIMSWTPDEVDRRMDEIAFAEQNGLIIHDY